MLRTGRVIRFLNNRHSVFEIKALACVREGAIHEPLFSLFLREKLAKANVEKPVSRAYARGFNVGFFLSVVQKFCIHNCISEIDVSGAGSDFAQAGVKVVRSCSDPQQNGPRSGGRTGGGDSMTTWTSHGFSLPDP